MEAIGDLDPTQPIPEVILQFPFETITLTHTDYDRTLTTLQSKLNQMASSKFYKSISVHFGAKSKQPINFLENYYHKKVQILKMELQQEKDYFKKIIKSCTEDELNNIEIQHQFNLNIINQKREAVEFQDFIPWIYVSAERKHWLYGHVTQEFNRKGAGTFNTRLGVRSPWLWFDTLEWSFEWPISKLRRKYYQMGLEWKNPIGNNITLQARGTASREASYQTMDTQTKSLSFSTTKEGLKYQLEASARQHFLYQHLHSSCSRQFYEPSNKLAVKVHKNLLNSINVGDVMEGSLSEVKAEFTIPFLSQAQFLKCQFNFRKFIDTFPLREQFRSSWIKKLFWKSTLEANLSISLMKNLNKCFGADLLENLDVRGFESLKIPLPSYSNSKFSMKFNLHDYPLLRDANIIPFVYLQGGLSLLKEKTIVPYWVGSIGLGLAYYVASFTQIEILYNLLQVQRNHLREPVNFQIRIGVFD